MFIANCTLKNIERNHGVAFLEEKQKSLILEKTNKNDIINVLGPPSTTSLFDNDIWIYIEKSTTKSSFIKLGKKKDLKKLLYATTKEPNPRLRINTKTPLTENKKKKIASASNTSAAAFNVMYKTLFV